MITVLENFFLNPLGLLALTALLPLITFYLIKKKPEKEVMPSMMFFMKDRESGKVQQAFQRIMKNWLLLLHIFIILGLSAAIAQPFIEAESSPENSVLILDKSASMESDFDKAKDFISDNLGEENSLIVVDNSVRVPVEEGSSRDVSTELSSIEHKDTESDIYSAIQTAQGIEGQVFIASDLGQSATDQQPESLIREMRDTGRSVEIMETSSVNSWGIVDLEIQEDTAKLDLRNFLDRRINTELDVDGGEVRELSIPASSLKTVELPLSEGENVFRLENDNMEADDTLYVSKPERQSYQVKFVSENENPFLREVFNLIEFTEFEHVSTPVEGDLDADIYIVGEADILLTETVEQIENDVRDGSGLVLFSNENLFDQGFDSLSVEKGSGINERTVSINEPVRTTVSTEVYDVNMTEGTELSSGSNALIRNSYGDGNLLFYNIDDRDFRHDFLYPIFWKENVQYMMDEPSIHDLNRETGGEIAGDSIIRPDGTETTDETDMDKTGFYEVSERSYSANLLSEQESSNNDIEIELEDNNGSADSTEFNLQNLLLIVLGLALLGEMAYLRRIGEIK